MQVSHVCENHENVVKTVTITPVPPFGGCWLCREVGGVREGAGGGGGGGRGGCVGVGVGGCVGLCVLKCVCLRVCVPVCMCV